jgi:hypothetical protein
MANKIPVKTITVSLLFYGIVLILCACMSPVDIQGFMEDEKVQVVIESTKGKVIIDPASDNATSLIAGDRKISGLDVNGYYMIETVKDEDDNALTGYPRFVSDFFNGPGSWSGDFGSITRISGGSINGLKNNNTYKIRKAVAVTGNFNYDDGSVEQATVSGGAIEITIDAPTTIDFSDYLGYKVMAVAIIPASPVPLWSDSEDIEVGNTDIPLEALSLTVTTKTVDYVFYKADNPAVFKFLRVKINSSSVPPTMVSNTTITGLTAPVAGASPIMTAITNSEYTGNVISWIPSDSTFAYNQDYTATINLTATSGYTFTGVTANSFTVNGYSTIHSPGSGTTISIQVTFPKTELQPVTNRTILGVSVPSKGGTPSATITVDTQYTGNISWTPNDGTFLPNTQYTATINLTAVSGYTFAGIALATNSSFTVAGATTVANTAGSGTTITVTAVFPTTATNPTGNANFTITFSFLDASTASALPSATISRAALYSGTTYTLSLGTAPTGGSWSNIKWSTAAGDIVTASHVNGTNQLVISDSADLNPYIITGQTFEVTVTATLTGSTDVTKPNGVYSTTVPMTVNN